MTSKGLGEMFEGESADMCAKKFLLVSMGGRAEGLACADPEARTPIGGSGIFSLFFFLDSFLPEGVVLRFWMLHGTRLKTKMRFVAKQIGG